MALLHMESLTKFTQEALNDCQAGMALLNTEMSLMRKIVLQNRMALDILRASQGGTCAIIQTECCVVIPDESSNVSSLLKHMKKQVDALSDPTPSLICLIGSLFSISSLFRSRMEFLFLLFIGILVLVIIFKLIVVFFTQCCKSSIQTQVMIAQWLEMVDLSYNPGQISFSDRDYD